MKAEETFLWLQGIAFLLAVKESRTRGRGPIARNGRLLGHCGPKGKRDDGALSLKTIIGALGEEVMGIVAGASVSRKALLLSPPSHAATFCGPLDHPQPLG